jgi:sarcosine oxidase subunit beta
LDKGSVGRGSTAYSAGHVRQHYSNEVTIKLAVRALKMFSHSEDELGGPTGFTKTGYLVVAPSGQELALREIVPVQQELGVNTAIVSAAEIAERFPEIDPSGVSIGALEPDSGYADPLQTVLSLVRSAAERWGLTVREGVEVLDIQIEHDRVSGVATSEGGISTSVVVNCAGPWAPRLARMVGLEYDFALSREHEAIFAVPETFGGLPVFSDVPNRSYFRPAGPGRVLVGEGYPKEHEPCDPDTYDDGTEGEVVRRLANRLAARVPSLRSSLEREDYGGTYIEGYSGVYDITADWNPIVGASDGLEGYFAAAGGSGHCFKIGPPIGEALAAVIAGQPSAIDLSPLGHQRFKGQQLLGSVWGPGNRA